MCELCKGSGLLRPRQIDQSRLAEYRAAPQRRKRALLETALARASRRGLYLEFGVASGQSINFIASRIPPNQTVHGFDSFEGLPEAWRPGFGAGFFNLRGMLPKVSSPMGATAHPTPPAAPLF